LYPFERFTERAKKVLTLAQEEAERSHHSYIGTEHLLLGLLREGEGLAAKVLNNLGVEINKVRATIESVLGRNERTIIQQIIPTSRSRPGPTCSRKRHACWDAAGRPSSRRRRSPPLTALVLRNG